MYEDRLILHQWILESEKVVWIDKAFYHYVKEALVFAMLFHHYNVIISF